MIRPALAILLILAAGDAAALGLPLQQNDDTWTPVGLGEISLLQVRVEVAPARDPEREVVMWSVDETLLIRNSGLEAALVHIGVPNAWSAENPTLRLPEGDFWAEAYVNGAPVDTDTVTIVPNPAFPSVTYRSARAFDLRLSPGESAHIRLLFALPAETNTAGERVLRFPFHLRPLWAGAIAAGVVVLRWPDRMFGFRTNLPDYAVYDDRAEWFLYDFLPSEELEVRFLSRQAVFQRVATHVGCPMPWEVMDRVAAGGPEGMREMLAAYGDQQLLLCAELPAAMRGSLAAARDAGLESLRLEQFMPELSGISGPLFVPNPAYRDEDLSEPENLYARFLMQELELRAAE